MKTTKKLTVFTAIMLILAGGMISCKDKENDLIDIVGTLYAMSIGGEEISVIQEDGTLLKTFCQWTELAFEMTTDNKVVIINSNEELRNYIDCSNDGVDPINVDFSEHTLLMARGGHTTGIHSIKTNVSQNATNRYTLTVSIFPHTGQFPETWTILYLVPKLSEKAIVSLKSDFFFDPNP